VFEDFEEKIDGTEKVAFMNKGWREKRNCVDTKTSVNKRVGVAAEERKNDEEGTRYLEAMLAVKPSAV
jgi:hypothetical protein